MPLQSKKHYQHHYNRRTYSITIEETNNSIIIDLTVIFLQSYLLFCIHIFIGQCLVCDDKEILYMTYVLRQYITDPKKKWTSLIINQNTFWRTEKEIPADSSSPVSIYIFSFLIPTFSVELYPK